MSVVLCVASSQICICAILYDFETNSQLENFEKKISGNMEATPKRVRRISLPNADGSSIKRKGAIRRKTFAVFAFNSLIEVFSNIYDQI